MYLWSEYAGKEIAGLKQRVEPRVMKPVEGRSSSLLDV
jgi:hypothetical protein